MNGGRPSSAEEKALGAVLPPSRSPSEPGTLPPAGPNPGAWDWERLDARLRPRLVNAGVRRFGLTREESEDILQDTLEIVFTKRPRVRNMEGYLVGSFFNRCDDRLSQRIRQRRREGDLDPDAASAFGAQRLVDGIRVRSAFRLLTPVCRSLIRSYCLLQKTLAEAAAEAGCTVPAIWKRLNQCMKRMRGCLG